MKETWNEISGFEGLYSVSNHGNIMSVKRHIILKPTIKKQTGYAQIGLYKNRVLHSFLVHRIVAKSFLSIVDGKTYINHLDGDKTNNNLKNLEWCTHGENQRHAIRTGLIKVRRGVDVPISKLKDSDVIEILKMISNGVTQQACADSYGVNQQTISKIVTGQSWRHITDPKSVIQRSDYGHEYVAHKKRSMRNKIVIVKP